MSLTFVQKSNSAFNGAGATTAATYGTHPTASNLLVACVRWAGAVTVSTILDTLGNTWVQIGTTVTAQGYNVAVYMVQSNISTGADTLTITWSSSPTLDGLLVAEYSGQGASALDSFIKANSAAGSNISLPSYPASYTNETLIAFGSTNTQSAISAPTVGTLRDNGSTNDVFLIDVNETTGGNYTIGATTTVSWSAFTVGFKSTTSTLTSLPLFIQQATQSSTTGSAPPLAFTSNNQAGNFLCIAGRGPITAVSDNQGGGAGNTWVQSPTNSNFWYVLSCIGGANSVTYTNTQNQVWVAEFSGIASRQTTGIVSPASGSGMALAVGPITPAQNNSMVIAFSFNSTSNGMVWTPGVALPFTLIQNSAGQKNAMGEWAPQTTAASVTPDLTSNTSIAWTFGAEIFAPFVFSITGNAGVTGATVTYTGPQSGSVTAGAGGTYTLPSLMNGVYTITPSLTGFTFSPASQNVTVVGSNQTGINFTATGVVPSTAWSPIDSRQAVPGFGPGPNNFRVVQGSDIYDVQTSDNPAVPGVDSRVTKPTDCRIAPNIPQNSRAPEV